MIPPDEMVRVGAEAWNETADDLSSMDAMRSALTAALAAMWQDHVIVPREPDNSLLIAGCKALDRPESKEVMMEAMLSNEKHAIARTKMRIRYKAIIAAIAQRIEHEPSKLGVEGSDPSGRATQLSTRGAEKTAQSEHSPSNHNPATE